MKLSVNKIHNKKKKQNSSHIITKITQIKNKNKSKMENPSKLSYTTNLKNYILKLIHFINLWTRWVSATRWWEVSHSRHTSHSWHTSWCSSLCTICSSNNWSPYFFNFLFLSFIFFTFRIWICIHPINGFLDQILNLFLVIVFDHVFKLCIIQSIAHLIRNILQFILCLNGFAFLFIFRLILLRIGNNFINFILTQSSLVRIDGNFRLIGRILLILCAYTQYTIGIQIKCHFNLWYTPWRRWNAHQLKLTQLIIVLC